MAFTGKRILLGVSGGIAAYKAAELARRLVSAGAKVKVVMTRAAQEFVGPLTFQALTGEKVATTMFGPGSEPLEHVALGQEVDAMVLAPATANLLGKMAAGIGDDLLTTILLAANKPILVCPAMNCEMWAHAAVQENVARLRARGLTVLEPESGELACGATGYGRLPEVETIMEALARLVSPQDLAGRRVLVTAGPTHEDLDPVRFLTNRSSGKQGYALAKAAQRRGAEVCLISGPTLLPGPHGVERLEVRSAREMLDAVLTRFPAAEALLMAAAVGDYHPTSPAEHKMKRGSHELTVHLTQNPDILKKVAALRKKQVVVGFAAETRDLETAARRKLEDKGLDLIVANEVNRPDSGFAVDTNEVTIIGRKKLLVRLPLLSKEEVAEKVLDQVAALLPRRGKAKVPEDPVEELRELTAALEDWLRFQRRLGWRGTPGEPEPPAAAQPPEAGRALTLKAIREKLGDCKRCKLSHGRTHIVFGEGSPRAALMFIGEGPGKEEDLQGLPFVGPAGQLLNRLLDKMGLRREEVYIANVVKSRPPENRNPEPDEIEACLPFLKMQIAAIRPRVIVTLGKIATQALLGTQAPLTRLRGQWHKYDNLKVMPTFHPSYLLRFPRERQKTWEDMQQVMEYLSAHDEI